MIASVTILDHIRDNIDALRRSERKVAVTVMNDPEAAMQSPIAALAESAGVSEPTVNRFCRNIGCSGFPDLKLKLAQSVARGTPYVSTHVEPGDGAEEYVGKIFGATAAALAKAGRTIDKTAVAQAVAAIAAAERLMFFGVGGSGAVATDALHKFVRLDVPSVAHIDVMMQRMAAAGLGKGDVLLVISNTGRTIPLLEVTKIAAGRGATVIGITAPDSPLAQLCQIVIGLEPLEDTDIYTPMVSRTAHLTVIDVLATGVILERGTGFQENLSRIKQCLRDTRVPARSDV